MVDVYYAQHGPHILNVSFMYMSEITRFRKLQVRICNTIMCVYLFPCSYELMQKCWSLDPDQRPTPIDIVATLTPLDGSAKDVKGEMAQIVEEDCKTNEVQSNGKHHISEYYTCAVNVLCCA